MIQIYFCDDEKNVTEKIQHYIIGYFINNPAEYTITDFNSGLELLKAIKSKRADVILLDIDLKDSHGIEIAKKIRQFDKKVKIIFITNYEQYKGEAFSVHAFGYIDKPVTGEKIAEQLDEVKQYLMEESKDISYKFETTDGLIEIALKEILYFVNENRKIKIVTFSSAYYMKQKLSVLEKQLSDYHFKSPHSSFLVNLDYVTDVKNYMVYMIDNIEIPLSQRKSVAFREAITNYLAKTIQLCREGNCV
ncbi:MAG TPA: response regulator transcription factor [Candidatus Merdenecus merdavium]|nr:response regulator transcription factor [Candidatus Merdenecus merdavium]